MFDFAANPAPLKLGNNLVAVRSFFCADYPVVQSFCNLQGRYLYVGSEASRTVQYKVSDLSFTVLTAEQTKQAMPLGHGRFSVRTGRPQPEFLMLIHQLFGNAAILHIPLWRCYLDYRVHLPKAIISLAVLVLGEIGLDLKKNGTKEQKSAMSRAFQKFNDGCASISM